jgi:serine protease Do
MMKKTIRTRFAVVAAVVGVSMGVEVLRAEPTAVEAGSIARVEDFANVLKFVNRTVEPAVVKIGTVENVEANQPGLPDLFREMLPEGEFDFPQNAPGGRSLRREGVGSGVVVDYSDGKAFIVTNNHVVRGTDTMTITFADGRETRRAKVLGTDPMSDLAVLEVEIDNVSVASWGDSDKLEKGDIVVAFGSPLGYVGSMTQGIVSALNRSTRLLGNGGYEDFIQTDAAINVGNSGGPLVNIRGEVVGINTAIASRSGGSDGLGFAIPSNMVRPIYEQLRSDGRVARGWLGVSIDDVTGKPELARSLGFEGRGVLVMSIQPSAPAIDKLQPEDIITHVDGKPVESVQQLRNRIAAMGPGKDVKLTIFREGRESTEIVTLGRLPTEQATAGPQQQPDAGPGILGLRLADATAEQLKAVGLDEGTVGAVVISVAPGSIAQRSGIVRGDVLLRIGNEPIESADAASEALREGDLDKGLRLRLAGRDGQKAVFLRKSE